MSNENKTIDQLCAVHKMSLKFKYIILKRQKGPFLHLFT